MIAARKISDAERRRFDAAANRLDYWIRRHTVPRIVEPIRLKPKQQFGSRQARWALGNWAMPDGTSTTASLTPIPPHLAALVEQLKMQK